MSETLQLIDGTHDEDTLKALSRAQNGGDARLDTVRDEAGNRAGFASHYPIDLTGYADAVAAALKVRLRAYAAARRFTAETSGVRATVGGVSVVVSTSRDMRDGMRDTMLKLLSNSRQDGDVLKVFADGVPRPATNAEAQAVCVAAGAHVQAAFNVEETLYPRIDAGDLTNTDQIDAAAWPPAP